MKVVVLTARVMPEGGVSLAAFRLARALVEAGHEAEVLYREGRPPADAVGLARLLGAGPESPAAVARALERRGADVVLVGSGSLEDLRAAAATAPSALHAHMHNGVCADNARYWARARRSCKVRAGWKCAALRPLLGCTSLKRSLDPGHVAAQRRFLDTLSGGEVGVLCVSTDQMERYARHGVPAEKLAALPNLGIRATPDELAEAARGTPYAWRDATAFFGRLSKGKGAQLLGPLAAALPAESRLRVFGDGYLAGALATLPAEVRCGHVDQDSVTGVLMWSRAVAFPSLWPEPGGIVGIDAQLMGAPLAAFDVGAPRHWPRAARFRRGDVAAMAAWLGRQEARRAPRDADAVAASQRRYWAEIGTRAAGLLDGFAAARRFPTAAEPAERLIASAGEGRGLGVVAESSEL